MSERRTASALAYLHPDFCFIMDDDMNGRNTYPCPL